MSNFMDKAKDLADKAVDAIPESVKDKATDLGGKAGELFEKAKDKLGLGHETPNATDAPSATDAPIVPDAGATSPPVSSAAPADAPSAAGRPLVPDAGATSPPV